MNHFKSWSLVLLFLCSCMASPQEEFRSRGKKIVKELVQVLQNVENHEELQAAREPLKKLYKKLASLLVEIQSFQETRPEVVFSSRELEGSEDLFIHLARLYEIPGCREIMERSQGDAVYLLLRGR
ncbi:MAG: hypothetical protein IT584_00225 [Chlamydiae bacterium]|nr:hypothetical protein [Chlamydiota bacterium]